MNIQLVSRYLGHFTWAIGLLMLPSVLWAPYFGEWKALAALLGSMAICGVLGIVLTRVGRNAPERMFQREGLALVGLGWLLTAGLGALPFILRGTLAPVDAYFESMSGFTTTGSTVLTDIEAVDKSILFWRSFTHWLGGMGIIVLFIAVLPYLGAGGKQLFKSESPGPDPRGLSPRIKDTASILWKIYAGLTVAQTILLMMAHMSFYDALCHTFGTLATGGFSPRNASVLAFDSISVDLIIIIFMVLAGTNFSLYFVMLRRDWTMPFKDMEWRVYLAVLAGATILITLNLQGFQMSVEGPPLRQAPEYTFLHALRVAAFQVVSITTTTGFCTDDFEQWPHFSRGLLVMLMFIGGCAGSTGGGLKVARIIILTKMAYWRVEKLFRPKTVRAVRIGGAVIDDDIQTTVYAFFAIYVFVFAVGTVFMSFLGLPFVTALTSVAATLNNIGPGLEHVGAIENFAFVSAPGKIFLSLCMVMGRLELFSICVLFLPSFWRRG